MNMYQIENDGYLIQDNGAGVGPVNGTWVERIASSIGELYTTPNKRLLRCPAKAAPLVNRWDSNYMLNGFLEDPTYGNKVTLALKPSLSMLLMDSALATRTATCVVPYNTPQEVFVHPVVTQTNVVFVDMHAAATKRADIPVNTDKFQGLHSSFWVIRPYTGYTWQ